LKIRLSLGPWYLASVLFVNAYIGLVITSLTTPFELNSIDFVSNLTKLQYPEQKIINENLWKEPITYYRDTVSRGKLIVVKHKIHPRPFQNDSEFRILSSIYYKGNYQRTALAKWLQFQYFWFQVVHKLVNTIATANEGFEYIPSPTNSVTDNVLAFNLYFPAHTYVPIDVESIMDAGKNGYDLLSNHSSLVMEIPSIVEKEITKCDRTVFADTSEVVEKEFEYLSQHHPNIQFFKSKETFFARQRYWSFVMATEDSPIVLKLRYLFCSGIYEYLQRIFALGFSEFRKNYTLSNKHRKKIQRNEPRAVSLQDRIQMSFVAYSVFTSACIISFMLEFFVVCYRLVEGLKHWNSRKRIYLGILLAQIPYGIDQLCAFHVFLRSLLVFERAWLNHLLGVNFN